MRISTAMSSGPAGIVRDKGGICDSTKDPIKIRSTMRAALRESLRRVNGTPNKAKAARMVIRRVGISRIAAITQQDEMTASEIVIVRKRLVALPRD